MSTFLTKRKEPETALDRARREMRKSLDQIEGGRERSVVVPRRSQRQPRLLIGLDLTSSREWGLGEARIATAAMFAAIREVGNIAVKLTYFRGHSECRESAWHDNPDILSRSMMGLGCEAGETQIGRILKAALRQFEELSGIVYVGDHCEEPHGELERLATELGSRGVPLFIFHECADDDRRSRRAKPLFRRMAERSGGFYVEFKPSSHRVLSELLSNVAAYAAKGTEGIERIELPETAEARALRHHLMLGTGR
jgi:hypothetical protein